MAPDAALRVHKSQQGYILIIHDKTDELDSISKAWAWKAHAEKVSVFWIKVWQSSLPILSFKYLFWILRGEVLFYMKVFLIRMSVCLISDPPIFSSYLSGFLDPRLQNLNSFPISFTPFTTSQDYSSHLPEEKPRYSNATLILSIAVSGMLRMEVGVDRNQTIHGWQNSN